MPHRSVTKTPRNTCIFVGPSLSGHPLPIDIEAFAPASRGMLTAALRSGFTNIGFIDGAVEESERLPLRELREALATPGIRLLGGASMGAVRAAQLASEGMHGVGRIYRLFSRGSLTDSDEVYVLHAPAGLRYRCLTLPLVNIRYTLRAMRLSGRISLADEHALLRCMREVPWYDRDRHSLSAAVYSTCGSSRSGRLMQAFDLMYRDVKREDALSLLSRLSRHPAFPQRTQNLAHMGIHSRALRRA